MRALSFVFFALCFGWISTKHITWQPQRIVGGEVTSIDVHPYAAALLWSGNLISYGFHCGGTIISNTIILSACHCFIGDIAPQWQIRVGSTYYMTGGAMYNALSIIRHPDYNAATNDNDIALLRTATTIVYSSNIASAPIASSEYVIPDNSPVTTIGWGRTTEGGSISDELRSVEIWTVNQSTCESRYNELNLLVTENMICSGWLDVGGRDACQSDSGGPLIYAGNVIVGVTSWGWGCAHPRYPGVWARISSYTSWIQAAAG